MSLNSPEEFYRIISGVKFLHVKFLTRKIFVLRNQSIVVNNHKIKNILFVEDIIINTIFQ